VAGLAWAIITTFFTAGGNQIANINPTQVN
jgi:hypothetical protein